MRLFGKYYLTQALRYSHLDAFAPTTDMIRTSTMMLCLMEVAENKLTGAMAEAGVYKGEFAKYMSQVLPYKDLHLFDTFKGFPSNGTEEQMQNFRDTTVKKVLENIKHKGRVILHEGDFEETSKEVNASYCFVSIDLDLYPATLTAIRYFYRRLVPGGYIFLHDFTSDHYGQNVQKAYYEFKKEMPFFSGVPIADAGGTIVITK